MSLSALIKQKIIANNGTISFAKFMELALYTNDFGYYQQINFGADFITAPEISPLFSQVIAKYIKPFPHQNILEFGAGSGKMATIILQWLDLNRSLPDNYFIIEISQKLRRQQVATISKFAADLLTKITWLDTMPDDFIGTVLLNEVFDAIPAERLVIQHQQPYQLKVGLDNQQNFIYIQSKEINVTLPFDNYPNGYISEYCPQASQYLSKISGKLNQGLVLIIDYGYEDFEYYHPDRANGSLTCFFEHHKHDNPFINIGKQDISVHINFTQLADTAKQHNLTVEDFTTQAKFLLANGITELAEQNNLDDLVTRLKTSQAIQKLTMPAQMGEVVKVLALTKL